ncbi:MAG: ABC transporter substrate-binding protein, partial [Pseudomonadota bacterium]
MTDQNNNNSNGFGMDRRQFTAAAAAGTVAASSGVMPALADTPRRGGRFRIGWTSSGADDTLNPELYTSANDYLRSYLVHNMLVRYGLDGGAEPDLATSWEANADATEWTFVLREGVEFHSGKTLDAEDVIYSLNIHRGEDTKSAIKGFIDPIKELKADGKNIVRITLEGPNADFPTLLGQPQAAIVPNGQTNFNDAPDGTGPFRVKRFEPGLSFLGERHENYWREGMPYFDEVEVVGIEDTQARVNALLTGDIHYVNRVGAQSSRLIERSPTTELFVVPSKRVLGFPMMLDREPS